MRPVLLPRTEIDKRRNEERRQLLVEGTRVAERVDTLRETAAKEEAALEQYRITSLKGIQEEIQAKFAERDKLDSDLKAKRKEWKEQLEKMYGPLDKQWMLYVKEEKARIEAIKSSYDKEQSDLQRAIGLNIQRERDNKENEQELSLSKLEYERLIVGAEQTRIEADVVLDKARNKAQAILSKAGVRDEGSKQRAQKVSNEEENITVEKAKLAKFAQELQEREFKVLAKELQYYSPVKKI